ncbi:hypothetical protein DL764_004672 [Monosporascus ibericus]|uniref:Ketoreductase (KR) domain-containing protein n=1 Tax=Monosporascus ibericus TaxID=155417 RepID=A0A4Q4TBX0_9PEZI|nr:hypothetical protein DL764_004672 [Monosporascus ibericus]
MVSLQIVQQSNALVGSLPQGLVALSIGATTGIGQSTLEHFAQQASSPRIYTVARPAAVASHESLLASLRQSRPEVTYNLITADVSLVSEVDKVVKAVKAQEKKLDILFLSAGFMPFEGRQVTTEGLDPSMSTRYYSRLRAVEQLIPLLNQAKSPRIVSVLAGGLEGPIKEDDLYLRDLANRSTWASSVQSTTMGTLALELFARENPKLSAVHWFPGHSGTSQGQKVRHVAAERDEPGCVGCSRSVSGHEKSLTFTKARPIVVEAVVTPTPQLWLGLIALVAVDRQ